MPDSHYRRNFLVLTLDGIFFFLGMIFISYEAVLPVYLARLGAPRVAIAVVPVAIALGINLPSLFSAPHVERLAVKRPFVLRFALWQRLPWVAVAVLTPIYAIGRPGLLVALILVSVVLATVAAGCLIPAFFDIMASTIPENRRGTLFAMRSVLSYLLGIAGGFLVRFILDRVPYPGNYSLLYAIASVILFAGMIAFSFIRESVATELPAPRPRVSVGSLSRVRPLLRANPGFRAYIIARAFLILAFAGTSFFPVYLVERFGLPDSVSGMFAIITATTFVVVNPVFGWVGNRIGYKGIFLASYASLAAAAVVGLFAAPAPWAYVLIVCAAISQSVNLVSWNMTIEFAPPGEVPSYIGVSGFCMGVVAPFAILSGVVVQAFGFAGLFAMTLTAAVAGGAVMAFVVVEPRVARRRINQPDFPI